MIRIEKLRQFVLWTYLAVSGFASIEPSPYELMFVVSLFVFAKGGVRFDKMMAPMIVCLLVFNAGGLLSLIPWIDEKESVVFIVITIYIAISTIFFAAIVAEAPLARMAAIKSGYIWAGLISALLGIVGYFNIAGTGAYFTLYDNTRAMGAFKDPNVFGPFLVPPVVWLFQGILLRKGEILLAAPKLLLLMLGIFLSFSRGAIFDVLLSVVLMMGLTFIAANSGRERTRVVMIALLGVGLVAVMLVIVLAIPNIRDMALSRTSLVQDYDGGEQGRFGNQVRSIPMLLELPFGFGPLRFGHIFPQDPHEVFISAFASFGWLGGIAFATFIAVTVYLGVALSLRRSPRQAEVIAIWSALLPQLLQGFQIDTSHWRHMFLLIGCLYGFAAAERIASLCKAMGRPSAKPVPLDADLAARGA